MNKQLKTDHQEDEAISKKVYLYGSQENKINRVALKDYEGNVSMALRKIIDAYKEKE